MTTWRNRQASFAGGEDAPAVEGKRRPLALDRQFQAIDFSSLTGRDYRQLHRQLRANEGPKAERIAYLGNVTLDPLQPFVTVEAARRGHLSSSFVGGFGQHVQDLASPALKAFAPTMIVLVLAFRQMRPDDGARFTQLSTERRAALCEELLDEIEATLSQGLANTDATILISNFPPPTFAALGIADASIEWGEAEFFARLNLGLIERMRPHPRAQILDLARIVARIGSARALDERLFLVAKSEWTEPMMIAIGEEIARHLVAATGSARKCLVVDLDNTLWGGVIGEDGPHGIVIGNGDPVGEAYLAFQHRVRALKDRGILLAICSKNNRAEVDALFRDRPDMPLRREDFSAVAASWQGKDIGLAAIAQALDIGLDALVFVDDNPAETALVRHQLPEVETITLPDDPSAFVATLDALTCFEKARLLADDLGKSAQYAQAAARVQAAGASRSVGDYLADLRITATIRAAHAADLPRLHQLFTKTNQFNVTSLRYSLGELERLLASPDHHVIVAAMADRFGDMGLVAASVLLREGRTCRIDSLLMSCRAMGRGLENALLNSVKAHATVMGAAEIRALYRRTPRNQPVSDLFAEQGFESIAEEDDGTRHYALSCAEAQPVGCDWIHIERGA